MERKIFVIEADDTKYTLLNKHLADLNYTTEDISRFVSIKDALQAPAKNTDIIFADLSSETDNLVALWKLQSHFINIPVIILVDKEDIPVQQTVHGYVVYGNYNASQLSRAISNAKEQRTLSASQHHKELLDLVKEQKEQLDSILFSINDAIWSRNADTLELTYANNAYYRLYNYPPEEMYLGKDIHYNAIYPDDNEKFFQAIDEVRTKGQTEIIYRHIHTDNSIKTLKARATLKKGVNGKPDMISGVTTDISKEKELHETIRITEQKLLATINNTKDLIWSVNKDLEIIFCNKPYKDFIFSLGGIVPKEGDFVLGDWGSESFVNSRKRDYVRALNGESFTTIVEEIYKGEILYNEISSSPIIDHDGTIIGVNFIARDISQQKKQFLKIREQNAKLKEIAWIQSHKVRGPVSNILGLTSLLDHGSSANEHTIDILNKLKTVANELDSIIREVVDTTFDIDTALTEQDIINSQN
jgi:PAS domain-containing protein